MRFIRHGRVREVLVLYQERSGEENFGERWRLERRSVFDTGTWRSRCGTFELCILNSVKSGENWRSGECIADGRLEWLSGRVFLESFSPRAGNAVTRVAIVLGQVRNSCVVGFVQVLGGEAARPYFGGLVNQIITPPPESLMNRSTTCHPSVEI